MTEANSNTLIASAKAVRVAEKLNRMSKRKLAEIAAAIEGYERVKAERERISPTPEVRS